MLATLFGVVAWLAGAQEGAVTRTTAPVIEIGAYKFDTDGRPTSWASTGDQRQFSGFIWMDLAMCSFGAGSSFPASAPMVWRVSGRLVSQVGDTYTLDLEWQRLGKPNELVGSTSSRQLALQVDQSELLERLTPESVSRCGTAETQLRAGVRLATRGTLASGGGGTGRTARAAPVQSGSCEVWLVHTTPTGETQADRQLVPLPAFGAYTFTFPPLTIRRSSNAIVLNVYGTLRVSAEGALQRVAIVISRRASADGAAIGEGRTAPQTMAMPGLQDVIAFDLPPVKKFGSSEDLLPGHQFSVRLRFKPVR